MIEIILFLILIMLCSGFYGIEIAIKNHTKEIEKLNDSIKIYLNFIGVPEPDPVVRVQMGDGRCFEVKY